MSTHTTSAVFSRISRHDGLFNEYVHDAYKAKGKLHEPSACTECGAVFHHGRWQWMQPTADAHGVTCPACQRIHDHYPAGFLTITGEFFRTHNDEIMQLVHHHEEREKKEHPLQRILAVEKKDGGILVTTTDIHLARGIGEALHHAYQGELDFHYNVEQNLLRVSWTH